MRLALVSCYGSMGNANQGGVSHHRDCEPTRQTYHDPMGMEVDEITVNRFKFLKIQIFVYSKRENRVKNKIKQQATSVTECVQRPLLGWSHASHSSLQFPILVIVLNDSILQTLVHSHAVSYTKKITLRAVLYWEEDCWLLMLMMGAFGPDCMPPISDARLHFPM